MDTIQYNTIQWIQGYMKVDPPITENHPDKP